MDITNLKAQAEVWSKEFSALKSRAAGNDFPWYPYDTLGNFAHLDRLLSGSRRELLELADGKAIADIGAADGALAFFLEKLGHKVDIIDYGPTNFNTLRGARLVKQAIESTVGIHELDLDSQFAMPRSDYGLIFFLGILYHLKNPFFVLESLAKSTRYLVVSTRVAKLAGPKKTEIAGLPVAYLVDPAETNNDSTNYWIFSQEGLRRIFKRTGWEVRDFVTVGNVKDSDPATPAGDERAFCLLESRRFV